MGSGRLHIITLQELCPFPIALIVICFFNIFHVSHSKVIMGSPQCSFLSVKLIILFAFYWIWHLHYARISLSKILIPTCIKYISNSIASGCPHCDQKPASVVTRGREAEVMFRSTISRYPCFSRTSQRYFQVISKVQYTV